MLSATYSRGGRVRDELAFYLPRHFIDSYRNPHLSIAWNSPAGRALSRWVPLSEIALLLGYFSSWLATSPGTLPASSFPQFDSLLSPAISSVHDGRLTQQLSSNFITEDPPLPPTPKAERSPVALAPAVRWNSTEYVVYHEKSWKGGLHTLR